MKNMKLFYSILISLLSVASYSQTILHQTESTTRTVQDPQTVIMAPGFRATSGVSNPFVAKIGPSTENPGGGPNDSQAGSNNPSGTSTPSGKSFHDTKGDIDVTSAGQLQFTLPIALPPGVKTVAPQVSLVYTSGSGNGIAGYGWNLSGITSISRLGKTIEVDGDSKPVQLDYSDYYSFNGQRLILKSGEYGKDGAEYVTEKYSNIKIRSIGMARYGNQLLYKPATFEVTFEDGSMAWYGVPPDSTSPIPFDYSITPTDYYITKWMDTNGNYISYKYSSFVNSVFLESIKWGGNSSLNKPHFNEMKFNYSDRSLKEISCVAGQYLQQSKILKSIVVSTNNNQFKKYEIQYKTLNTNYQFVDYITEYNSANEAANPILFENYPDPAVQNLLTQDSRFDEIYGDDVVAGDFNGDGKLDFVKGNKLMLSRLDGNNNFYTVQLIGIPVAKGSSLKNGKMVPKDVLYTVSNDADGKTRVRLYEFNSTNFDEISSNVLDFSIFNLDSTAGYSPVYNYSNPISASTSGLKFLEGDFNGDGISEFIVSTLKQVHEEIWGYDQNGYPEIQGGEVIGREVFDFYFDPQTNILKRVNLPFSDYSRYNGPYLFTDPWYYKPAPVGDFDGDGKTDVFNFLNGTKIYSLNKQTTEFELKAQASSQIGVRSVVFLGDFNGDGKTDVLSPVAEDSSDWKMFISTGEGISEHYYSNLALYKPTHTGKPTKSRVTVRTYFTPDFNRDGKSDFLHFQSEKWFRELAINNPDSSYGFVYFRNDGVDSNGKPIFTNAYSIATKEATSWGDNESEDINYSKYGEHYQPLVGNFRLSQFNTSFAIIHKTKLITWDLGSKLDQISRIKSITQGGIKTDVEYSPLVNEGNIYRSYIDVNSVNYPHVNVKENLNYFVVSKLVQGSRKQDFRYRDLIGNLHGRGIIGFRQTARSTFYADGFEVSKVWTGTEIQVINESLPYKDWSIRTTDESKIFPLDISLNNSQLLSFKQYEYKIDRLLNGNVVSNVAAIDRPKIVLAINPFTTITKDFLTNTKTVQTVEQYDNFYLPKKSVTKINDGYSVSTSELEYYPADLTPGSSYSIGKPKTKTATLQAYGDTKSFKEEFVYENNLLKTLKRWNRDNSGYLQETYEYDGFGNVTEKLVSNSVDTQAQLTKSEYDSKGRFVEKKTDNLGLETNITYNDWGQVLTQTDPLGNTVVNSYDRWGKLEKSKTNLSGTTTYKYEKDNSLNTIVSQYNPDGDISIKYTNKLGQDYKESSKAFAEGQFVSVETQYDNLGRKTKQSEPYFEGQGASQWNVLAYDDSVLPVKTTATSFNGKQTETTVTGLTTTVKELNGYGRSNSKTVDALGNVISSNDKGGTVSFVYNAEGQVLKAQYAENIVTTKYDSWGRKWEFNDPSNGLYKYEYNGLGQPKKILSPKGSKEFVYNNLGQIITQKEVSSADAGQATNKTITFAYDNKGRIISKSGTSGGKAYSSNVSYDDHGRLLSSSESGNGKYFIKKGITYDDKARVIYYEKQLYSSGQLTKVTVENIYSNWNGDLQQIKDKNSGKVLWSLSETNASGLVLRASLGGSRITNTYDSNGFLSNMDHQKRLQLQGMPSLLQISYNFNAIKNELSSRITGGDLSITETFDYDDNNRLVNWTNPVTGVKPAANRNIYDIKGRITQNDHVGTIKFDNSAKIYQPTGMILNTAGDQNYNNDLIQTVVYNENNDPVFIDGGKGDVAFQYGLTAMRQRVTYGGNFDISAEGKFTKYYSEDGSFEVVRNNSTGQEKHILYIGGSPYESNIIYLKNFDENSASFKFLHKDYIGSILAISDQDGNKVEQRHFDAWGNLTHLKIGNGAVITDANTINNTYLLVDRGYTGHEHFMEVGIIHMNGRLYDPLLRRFLNADENIQDPYNTQNYNKYGYVFNNPLLFSDPSGEFVWWVPAVIAIVSEVFTMYYTQTPFDPFRFAGNLAMSYASAGIAGKIGDIFKVAAVTEALGKTGTILARAGAHAITQGVLSYVQGGNFWSGALAGSFASASSDLLGLATSNIEGSHFLKSDAFALLNGATSGGVGSVLGGGNFWMGAGQGLIVTAFNYLAHAAQTELEESSRVKKALKTINLNPRDKPNFSKESVIDLTVRDENLNKMYKDADYPVVSLDSHQDEPGSTIASKITLGKKAFQSYRKLYLTLGHEFIHAFHNASGIMDYWINNFGIDQAKYNTERGAYTWLQLYDAPSLRYKWEKLFQVNYGHLIK